MPKRQRTCSTCAGEWSRRGRCRSCAFVASVGGYFIPSPVRDPSRSVEAGAGAHQETNPDLILDHCMREQSDGRLCACSDDPDGDVESDIEENEDMAAVSEYTTQKAACASAGCFFHGVFNGDI